MGRIGIEKINLYGCSLCLKQADLAIVRGKDPQRVVDDYLIDTRSLNPPYEDTITMGINAAASMLTEEDCRNIGMFIVGTEGSVDFGKPISTNMHRILGLPSAVRTYETKHACYGGVAALDAAINWIASGLNQGRKALVIVTDFSRRHFGKDWEFVLGGGAAALLISDAPRVIEFETTHKGTYTFDVYDTYRPTARHEMGNNEVSLYSYSDALEGAFRDYAASFNGGVDFDGYFDYNVYHMPFPAMAFQAHRILCNLARSRAKSEVRESFLSKVMPSLRFATRVGSMYGASNFFGICGLLKSLDAIEPGARVGFFAYGSGAIGEYYSARICPEAKEAVESMDFDNALDQRRRVNVEEYELVENLREQLIENPDYVSEYSILDNWYYDFYKGRRLLTLAQVKNFQRIYQWS